MVALEFALFYKATYGFVTTLSRINPSPFTSKKKIMENMHSHVNNRRKPTSRLSILLSAPYNDMDNNDGETPIQILVNTVKSNPTNSISFSLLMSLCGAALGPFLDSYHSLFGVLTYDTPLVFPLLGTMETGSQPLLTCVTTFWVPPLFGLAGFLIGWLYIWLDAVSLGPDNTWERKNSQLHPSLPKVLIGISYFTFQYWLSGICYAHDVDRSVVLTLMSALAAGGFIALDGTLSGLVTSAATAIGGPLIEIGLISFLPEPWGYHYNDLGETGFFPFWIVPVYFLGGPANGNLARSFWNSLGNDEESDDLASTEISYKYIPCDECKGTRVVPCPNCDGGTYVTYNQKVVCNACRGKGRVICRKCFNEYGDDPNDIERIRKIVDDILD
jgi:hypothetical protein